MSILGRPNAYAEDTIISTYVSIEAAGGVIGKREGERATYTRGKSPGPSTSTYAYRCLDALNVAWPDRISDRVALARGLAKVYNDLKHYSPNDYPDHDVLQVVNEINEQIVRLLAIYITGRAEELLEGFRRGEHLHDLKFLLDEYGLRVDSNGNWQHDAELIEDGTV
jgi:hypothetical protein